MSRLSLFLVLIVLSLSLPAMAGWQCTDGQGLNIGISYFAPAQVYQVHVSRQIVSSQFGHPHAHVISKATTVAAEAVGTQQVWTGQGFNLVIELQKFLEDGSGANAAYVSVAFGRGHHLSKALGCVYSTAIY